ncbi:MAG: hypothetical protein P1V51_24465 [Deltaproteobacteria bacterium]|nr:hypothetical protein [Deltaproteobacteria bacterium]
MARWSWRPARALLLSGLPAAALLLIAAGHDARGGFDPITGRVRLDASDHASASLDTLASLSEGPALWVSAGDGSAPLDDEALSPLFLPASEALEGAGALRLGGRGQWITLDLAPLAGALAGRRIEVSFWQRPDGRRIGGGLFWEDPAGQPFPPLRLRPTGRRTDDGWEEWSSGPVDALLGGLLPPAVLELGDEEGLGGTSRPPMPVWPVSSSHGVVVDAIRVLDLGEAAVVAADCAGLEEGCGPAGLCMFGRCTDRAAALGPDPAPARLPGQLLREQLEVALFEGGQASRLALAEVLAGMARAGADPPWGFHRQLAAGARPLRDDHHSPPYAGHWWLMMARAPFVGCALLGEADLLGGSPRLPLILDPRIPGLEVGDAILEIDGLTPRAWLEAVDPLLGYNGDPGGREPAGALHLLGLATFLGSRLRVARCEAGLAPGADACAAAPVHHELSLAEATAAVWTEGMSGGFSGYACEPRVRRTLGTALHDPGGGRDQPFVGDDGGVRYLRFDDFIGSTPAFAIALRDGPARVIIDERIGNGGYSAEVDHLGSFLVSASEGLGYEDAYFADASISEETWEALRTCQAVVGGACGGFFAEPLPMEGHPAPAAAAGARVAVLTHRDVSGNDFFTHLMSVRAGEVSGGAIQVADSRLIPAGGEARPFLTGSGAGPDEWILQTQSDLLRGTDTVLEAARAWVSQ